MAQRALPALARADDALASTPFEDIRTVAMVSPPGTIQGTDVPPPQRVLVSPAQQRRWQLANIPEAFLVMSNNIKCLRCQVFIGYNVVNHVRGKSHRKLMDKDMNNRCAVSVGEEIVDYTKAVEVGQAMEARAQTLPSRKRKRRRPSDADCESDGA